MQLKSLALPATWLNQPTAWEEVDTGEVRITAGVQTDFFADPQGQHSRANAPCLLFEPMGAYFTLQARVEVSFESTFDAGVLMLYVGTDHWAKLCFELSPQQEPMVVSVVTRGFSDDCNGRPIAKNFVHLRIARIPKAFAFHYSLDGEVWHLVRFFSLGERDALRIGFSAQSPTGEACTASFAAIHFEPRLLENIRDGS